MNLGNPQLQSIFINFHFTCYTSFYRDQLYSDTAPLKPVHLLKPYLVRMHFQNALLLLVGIVASSQLVHAGPFTFLLKRGDPWPAQTDQCPATSSSCPTTLFACDQNSCAGLSYSPHLNADPTNVQDKSYCTAGQYVGCECASTCSQDGSLGKCWDDQCQGYNVDGTDYGICSTGKFRGCKCASVCDSTGNLGPCKDKGCAGINMPVGFPSRCTGGDYVGCACQNVCGPNGSCSKCNGKAGICTTGDYIGCTCDD